MKYEIIHDENGHDIWDDLEGFVFVSNNRNYNSIGTKCVLNDFDGEDDLKEHFDLHNAVKVYGYTKGGVKLSLTPFSCQWDSGLFGYLLYPKDVLKVDGFIEEWSQNWNGENYGYVITDDEGEELESCWGYVGYENCENEAKYLLQWYEKDAKKKRENRVKTLIRHRVPLTIRQGELCQN